MPTDRARLANRRAPKELASGLSRLPVPDRLSVDTRGGDIMGTKLIRLDDGLLVEVEAEEGAPTRIAANAAADVGFALDKVQDLLRKAITPVTSVWSELNRDLTIEKVEVNLALGFEAEGNVFIARGSGSANVSFKLIVRPSDDA